MFVSDKPFSVLRVAAAVSVVAVSLGARAFDSAEWLGRKEILVREAERLEKVYASTLPRLESPAENVSVPVETYPDGSVKTLVTAAKAQLFHDEGIVWAKDVTARDYAADRSVVSSIFADNCVVDRETKSGWVEGKSKALHGRTEISGSKVYISFAENFVMIFSDATLKSDDVSGKGKGSAEKKTLSVKSQKADYDRAAGVIRMEGKVSFVDGEYSLAADEAWVFLSGTNELKRVVASGSVAVTNGLKRGYCDRALYERGNGKIVMYARSAAEPARLVDTDPEGGELCGSRIYFRTDAEQVEVDNPVITVSTDGRDRKDFLSRGEKK